ncbi:MAG: hypothetical protein J6Q65_03330, partial [Lentisphaeria bacterium]|nr:hypothetical protein [Lentisphaeria bacterium]
HKKGSLTIDDSFFHDYKSSENGSVILADGKNDATITVEGSLFKNNSGAEGGVIYADLNGGKVNLTDTMFRNNSATGNGGALYVTNSTVTSGGGEVITHEYITYDIDGNDTSDYYVIYNDATGEYRFVSFVDGQDPVIPEGFRRLDNAISADQEIFGYLKDALANPMSDIEDLTTGDYYKWYAVDVEVDESEVVEYDSASYGEIPLYRATGKVLVSEGTSNEPEGFRFVLFEASFLYDMDYGVYCIVTESGSDVESTIPDTAYAVNGDYTYSFRNVGSGETVPEDFLNSDVEYAVEEETIGGGSSARRTEVNLYEVDFKRNTATIGGAAYFTTAEADMLDVTIRVSYFGMNEAEMGGAIYAKDIYTLKMEQVVLESNEASKFDADGLATDTSKGGALYLVNVNTLLTNNTFHNNNALTGAAIFADGNEIYVANTTMLLNQAHNSGGMIHIVGGADLYLVNDLFVQNGSGDYFMRGDDVAGDFKTMFNITDKNLDRQGNLVQTEVYTDAFGEQIIVSSSDRYFGSSIREYSSIVKTNLKVLGNDMNSIDGTNRYGGVLETDTTLGKALLDKTKGGSNYTPAAVLRSGSGKTDLTRDLPVDFSLAYAPITDGGKQKLVIAINPG